MITNGRPIRHVRVKRCGSCNQNHRTGIVTIEGCKSTYLCGATGKIINTKEVKLYLENGREEKEVKNE